MTHSCHVRVRLRDVKHLSSFYFRTDPAGKIHRIDSPGHAPALEAALAELDAARTTLETNPTDQARAALKEQRAKVQELTNAAASPDRRAHLVVEVAISLVGARLVCTAVQVLSTPTDASSAYDRSFEPGRDPETVSAGIWRQVRIGELVEEATRDARGVASVLGDRLPPDTLALYESVAKAEVAAVRPGPKVRLTADLLLGIVIPAYLTGGRTPLKSVQRALTDAGYNNGYVTIDQARAAVRKAKKLTDLDSPARRKGSDHA